MTPVPESKSVSVPASTHSITAEWLTEALQSRGKLNGNVADVRLQPIGEGVGLMGELGRLHMTFEGDESLPNTVVAKCAAQNDNRQVAQLLDFYGREVAFYNQIAADCPMRVPNSYYADIDRETCDFVLLMDDLGDVSPRDQLEGASAEEVYSGVENVAEMHAIWWGASAESHPWMYDMMSTDEATKLRDALYMPALEPTISNFDYVLDNGMSSVLRTVGENFTRFWGADSPDAFVHGDYRQDNMLYPDGAGKPFIMDWQISGRAKPVFDIAYFMCQSLTPSVRREIEHDVLKFYVSKLGERGVQYSYDECLEAYRRLILGCLVYPITVCGTLDLANDRGKALAEAMLTRNLEAISDLDCSALV